MSESELNKVTVFNKGEIITQIMPFGNNSLVCLTSDGRILTPGPNFGEWFEFPLPPKG